MVQEDSNIKCVYSRPSSRGSQQTSQVQGGKGGQAAARRQNRGPQCQGGTAQLGTRARAPEH